MYQHIQAKMHQICVFSEQTAKFYQTTKKRYFYFDWLTLGRPDRVKSRIFAFFVSANAAKLIFKLFTLLRGFPTFKIEIDPHFSTNEFLALFACYIICQYISLGSIVLKLFLTMKNTIFPIRPAGKCIQIQFIKSDLSWIGFFTILLSRNSDN